MKCVAVVGAGPVGLATADHLSRADASVLLICPRVASPDGGVMRQTWPAALAFWTPFFSGLSPEQEKILSRESLEFYKPFRDRREMDAGVVWRTVEHYWQEGTCTVPAWTAHEELRYEPLPQGAGYCEHRNVPFRWRCEYRYEAPVIDVDRFLGWYLEELESRPNVQIVRDWQHPLDRGMWSNDESRRRWFQILDQQCVSSLVMCTGANTVYRQLVEQKPDPSPSITFKKGVVARVATEVNREDRALLYHGGTFDRDALCYVPHQQCIVLGGIVHDAERFDRTTDWQVLPAERDGILHRAETFLPTEYRDKLARAGLWASGGSKKIEWRAGVRPMLQGRGPQIAEAPRFSQQFRELLDREIRVVAHFGHGGSGFTLSHHTARLVAEELLRG